MWDCGIGGTENKTRIAVNIFLSIQGYMFLKFFNPF